MKKERKLLVFTIWLLWQKIRKVYWKDHCKRSTRRSSSGYTSEDDSSKEAKVSASILTSMVLTYFIKLL